MIVNPLYDIMDNAYKQVCEIAEQQNRRIGKLLVEHPDGVELEQARQFRYEVEHAAQELHQLKCNYTDKEAADTSW